MSQMRHTTTINKKTKKPMKVLYETTDPQDPRPTDPDDIEDIGVSGIIAASILAFIFIAMDYIWLGVAMGVGSAVIGLAYFVTAIQKTSARSKVKAWRKREEERRKNSQ